LAVSCGFQNVIDVLLDKGANVSSKDFNGNTPLHLAVQNGNISVIESLVSRQPQVAYEQNHVRF